MLTVEDFCLEDLPECLDLAVSPGRADLGPQVLDAQVSEALAEHVLSRQEQKSRTFLVTMTTDATTRIGGIELGRERTIESGWASGPSSWASRTARIRKRTLTAVVAHELEAVRSLDARRPDHMARFAEYYNYHRLSGVLGWLTPAERYLGAPFTDRGFQNVPALAHLQTWLQEVMNAA